MYLLCYISFAYFVMNNTIFQYENTRKVLIPATLIGLVYSAIIYSNQWFVMAGVFLLLSAAVGASGMSS